MFWLETLLILYLVYHRAGKLTKTIMHGNTHDIETHLDGF